VAHVVTDIDDPSLTEEGPIDRESGKDIDQGYSGDQEEGDSGDNDDQTEVVISADGKKTKRPRLGLKKRQKLKEKKVRLSHRTFDLFHLSLLFLFFRVMN
jgi:hypothetical protein